MPSKLKVQKMETVVITLNQEDLDETRARMREQWDSQVQDKLEAAFPAPRRPSQVLPSHQTPGLTQSKPATR